MVPVSAAIWPRQIGASSTSTPLARAFSASILTCSGVQVDDTADHAARAHRLQQSALAEHHRGGLVVVADRDDDELAGAADLGRRLRRLGAERARGLDRLRLDVLRHHRVAVLDEMPHHRLAHPPGADDADFFLVRHVARLLPLCGRHVRLPRRQDKRGKETMTCG